MSKEDKIEIYVKGREGANLVKDLEVFVSRLKYLQESLTAIAIREGSEPVLLGLESVKESSILSSLKPSRPLEKFEKEVYKFLGKYFSNKPDGFELLPVDIDNIKSELGVLYKKHSEFYNDLNKDVFDNIPTTDCLKIVKAVLDKDGIKNVDTNIIFYENDDKSFYVKVKETAFSKEDMKDDLGVNRNIKIDLSVIKPDFEGDTEWLGTYNNDRVKVKIEDINFLNKYQNQEAEGPYPKDTIRVLADIYFMEVTKKTKRRVKMGVKEKTTLEQKAKKIVVKEVLEIIKFNSNTQDNML